MGFVGLCVVVLAALIWISFTVASAPDSTARPTSAGQPASGDAGVTPPAVDPVPVAVSPGQLARLPQATTYGTVADAPPDLATTTAPSGQVVHPAVTVAVYASPGGRAIAALPSQEAGNDTWLPVISRQSDWARVVLPVRPNGSTGWLYLASSAITEAVTPYRILVDREHFTLTLFDDNRSVGRWPVGVGLAQSVTPVGRTFILASLKDPTQPFSPIILPLGIHSNTYADYSGGPGTIGIHGWPSQTVYDRQSSHGCIRVPAQALAVLSTQVPIGTPVLIS